MRFLKKIICLVLSMAFIAMSCIFNSVNAVDKQAVITRNEVEWKSVKENTDLLNYFYRLAPDRNYDGKYFPDYYGGSLIADDGSLVIMLTDDRGKEIVNSFVHNAKFVSCDYSYSELVNTINSINAKIAELSEDNMHKDTFVEMFLVDEDNLIEVVLRDTEDRTIEWFRKNICDKPYLHFTKMQGEPENDILFSGNKVAINGLGLASSAFRVIRTTDDGPKYGFLTCAHGNKINDNVCDEDTYTVVGKVKLRQLGGAIDAAYAEMSNSSDYTNIIRGSIYTLNNDNDDLFYPIANQSLGIFARYHQNNYGVVTSTNYSRMEDGKSFSGLYLATYPRTGGDSGGLIASSPVNNSCNPAGIHKGSSAQKYYYKGKYDYYAVFTGAIKAISYFHFMRY